MTDYIESALGFINTAIVPIALLFGRIWYTRTTEANEIKKTQTAILADLVASIKSLKTDHKALCDLHDDPNSKFSTVGMMTKLVAIETKLGMR